MPDSVHDIIRGLCGNAKTACQSGAGMHPWLIAWLHNNDNLSRAGGKTGRKIEARLAVVLE